MAYVTGCTDAFRPISARRSRILISAVPCGGVRPPSLPCAPLKKRVDRPLYYYLQHCVIQFSTRRSSQIQHGMQIRNELEY